METEVKEISIKIDYNGTKNLNLTVLGQVIRKALGDIPGVDKDWIVLTDLTNEVGF